MMTAWPALQPFDYEAIRAWQTISWLHSSPTDFGFFTPAHSLNEDPLAFFAAPGACYSPAVDRCSPTFAAQPQSGESYAPGDSLGNLLKLAESVFESKLGKFPINLKIQLPFASKLRSDTNSLLPYRLQHLDARTRTASREKSGSTASSARTTRRCARCTRITARATRLARSSARF